DLVTGVQTCALPIFYLLGKAASLTGNSDAAEKAWLQVIKEEPESSLAAQARFGLANLYRKQGKSADAEREMEEFKKLQKPTSPRSEERRVGKEGKTR